MGYDITVRHPLYVQFAPAWELMRDAFDGEDCIKAKDEKYLPMKTGTAAIEDVVKRKWLYEVYKLRAEFPELVAPTVRGSVGIMLKQSANVELPKSMEFLREKATQDGLTLESLHQRIAIELMTTGRYGLLPGIDRTGTPYLAGYTAESIINWDSTDNTADYVVLDESGQVRDRETNTWDCVEKYLECGLDDSGNFYARQWVQSDKTFAPTDLVLATDRQKRPLKMLPFVFIGANDLAFNPDDVPLYGLGRLAVRIYRLDADYTTSLHMTSEPTPVVIGFADPKSAREAGHLPKGIGASTTWVLPPDGDAKFLEFSGSGISAQKEAIADALTEAVAFGSQILSNTSKAAESGNAIQLRLGNQYSLLHLIAKNSAAGLERALRNIAIWIGEDPEKVNVVPNLEFFEKPLTAQDITALVGGWQAGAYSYSTMFDRLKRGKIVPMDRTEEDEKRLMAEDPPPEQVTSLPPDMQI